MLFSLYINREKEESKEVSTIYLKLFGLSLYSWPYISGGYGNGALPSGIYKIGIPYRLAICKANEPYKKEGFPWFSNLFPMFETNRTNLGIHPDGNVYGTLGCIGILKEDVLMFYIMEKILKHFKMNLIIKG